MTATPIEPPAPVLDTLVARAADALGWTPGQVWTTVIGLVIAVPAAVLGLGPALQDVDAAATQRIDAVAAPADPPASTPATPAPEPTEAALSPAPTPSPAPPSTSTRPSPRSASPAPAAPGTDASAPPPPLAEGDVAMTIAGEGQVRAIARTADLVVAVLDLGSEHAGRILVFGEDGSVALDAALEVDGTPHHRPGGIATDGDAVVVSTAEPPAVLRVDPADGRAAVLAEVPDLPLCAPVVRTTGCEPGLLDRTPAPGHLAAGDDATVHLLDPAQGCVLRITDGEDTADPWWCDAVLLAGPDTPAGPGSGGAAGIATTADRVVVSVAASTADATDGLIEIAVGPDGDAGTGRRIADAPEASGIAGIGVLDDGRVVAALSGADALLVVDRDATRVVTIAGVTGPQDVEPAGRSLLIAHRWDGGAGRVTEVEADALDA